MMKIEQKKLAVFCETVRAMVAECRMMITSEGINTLAVDAAIVGMVQVNLPKASFDEFSEDEKIEIGMDMSKWKDMLDVMKDPKSIITIERIKDSNKIRITDGKYTYTHAPLDVTTVRKRPNMPKITLPAAVAIDAAEFKDAIRAMTVIADKGRFGASKDGLALDAEGDTDHLRKVIDLMDGSKPPVDPVSSLFSLDYMTQIAKVMKEAGQITAHVGQDHPIRFDFDINGMEVSYLIAPTIESEGGP